MILATICAALLAGAASAQVPVSYALIVGSNQAGPGQQALQHAHDDATRVHDVLVQLGGYEPGRVDQLRDPSAVELLEHLDAIAGQLARHEAQDEDAVLLFYYSGHAKSQALELGEDQLPLEELKTRLEAAGADLTLVFLDACQAGAISKVKGAKPAADFSHNATAGLNTEGLAVLASSSGSELSQESTELGGSYFTHHLVTGLRGAADMDGDGQVTLAEAHHYAYHRTLVSTAQTAVGRQHVTMETDLRGRGDTVLTHPGQASALLSFAGPLAAEVLLFRADTEIVTAELHKASGSPVSLALVPGAYEALVHQGEELRRCKLDLAPGTTVFSTKGCRKVRVVAQVEAKGGQPTDNRIERWMLETSLGFRGARESDYTQRLEEFGFERSLEVRSVFAISGSLSHAFYRHVAGVLTVGDLDMDGWRRELEPGEGTAEDHRFKWQTWRMSLAGRGTLPLLRGWLVPYVQAGAGPAMGLTRYTDTQEGITEEERHWGFHLCGGGGIQFMPNPGKGAHAGIFHQAEIIWAPVIENLLGDVHDSGGVTLTTGIRVGF